MESLPNFSSLRAFFPKEREYDQNRKQGSSIAHDWEDSVSELAYNWDYTECEGAENELECVG